VARWIHEKSERAQSLFVEVNCAAIPSELIESELFGHEKGAFTGAMSMKKGKFDLASGGTLFLDEIGDMSLKTQAKILRILQEQKFERVGGTRTISVDVRIVAATNKDLEEEIKGGAFREDLYFRLNVIPLHVPPLRERKEDIILLFKEFIEEFSRTMAMRPGVIREEIANALMVYDWPGNVRELRNLAERLVILGMGREITLEDLPKAFRKKMDITDTSHFTKASWLEIIDYREAKDTFDREFLVRRLEENHGNIKKTAEAIGIERRHLHRKLKALGIHF
jgi:two-component system nitrogen regulation response regulator NtrX